MFGWTAKDDSMFVRRPMVLYAARRDITNVLHARLGECTHYTWRVHEHSKLLHTTGPNKEPI